GRTGDTELLGATLPLCRARVSPAKPSGRWSSPDLAKGHLRHVDCTAAEAAFAIHQIVAPELMKLVTETIQRASGHGCVVAVPPLLQRFRIIQSHAWAAVPPA